VKVVFDSTDDEDKETNDDAGRETTHGGPSSTGVVTAAGNNSSAEEATAISWDDTDGTSWIDGPVRFTERTAMTQTDTRHPPRTDSSNVK
jgi:hypothetical protein